MDDLEATFLIESAPASNGSGASGMKGALAKKQGVTTLLDITRANNVGEF